MSQALLEKRIAYPTYRGGDLKGKYIGIRILPPYPDTEEIKYAAYDLGGITGANDILLRGVEPITYKNRKLDKKCIDLIGKINFDSKKRRIGNYLKSKNLALEGYSLIELL